MGIKMPDNTSARDALVNRQLPEMVLSDGSPASLTGPPPPMPHYLNAEGRAMKRFEVEGNAISALLLRAPNQGLGLTYPEDSNRGRRDARHLWCSSSLGTWLIRTCPPRHQHGACHGSYHVTEGGVSIGKYHRY